MKTRHALALAVLCAAGAAPAQPVAVPIRIVVKQRDLGAPTPFPRVPGFTIQRNDKPFANASCPDASDARGELTCKLTCPPSDRDATLLLIPPMRDGGGILAGMKSPGARELKIADCHVLTPQPVELVYRTAAAQLADLRASSPAVFDAVAVVADGKPQLKPFAAVAPTLEALAGDDRNRRAILELGEVGQLASESRTVAVGATAGNPADYAAGAKSIVLKAQAAGTVGADWAAKYVTVSPEPVELDRSINRVTRKLAAKPVLNKDEVHLERAAKSMSGTAAFGAGK